MQLIEQRALAGRRALIIFTIKTFIFMIKRQPPTTLSPPLATWQSLETLLEAVRSLYGAMDRFDAAAATSLGVDRTAVRAVSLMEHGPVSPGQIGESLSLSSGAVTALLHRLEEAGHIARIATDDGRRRDAQLTATGRRAAHREFQRLGPSVATQFADRDAAALAQLAYDLEALARAFGLAADATSP